MPSPPKTRRPDTDVPAAPAPPSPAGSQERVAFETMWNKLGIGDRAAGLDLAGTITPRTFAASSEEQERAVLDGLPITIPSLPHISLAKAAAPSSSQASSAG